MALLIHFILLSRHIKLPEEVEGNDGVDVHHDCQEHDGQDELFSVVGDGLQNDPQSSHANSHIKQMSGKEKVVVIAQQGKE